MSNEELSEATTYRSLPMSVIQLAGEPAGWLRFLYIRQSRSAILIHQIDFEWQQIPVTPSKREIEKVVTAQN
jgi:hypothetical protein